MAVEQLGFVHDFRPSSSGFTLEELRKIFATARECRARMAAKYSSLTAELRVRDSDRPWREFLEIAGEPQFSAIVDIVQKAPPSEGRDLAGDIMAELLHPCAVGRLLEAHERRGDSVLSRPPLDIYRNLGGIGTEAAATALMWLWGCKWDADIASALAMCDSEAAQDFLMRQARQHPNAHVRSMCIAGVFHPITREKCEFFVERLEKGGYNEQYFALYAINDLKVAYAADALVSLRKTTTDLAFIGLIDEALPLLRQLRA